ncbi:MAG: aldehyde dehydrogenase [Rikenellaceae bacterium]|nr:aldehyde dehydrogenase [Rikenellaceae bacterium]
MKSAIDLFSALGERLRGFERDPRIQAVAQQACSANDWFTLHEIGRAIGALVDNMLQPELLRDWLKGYAVPVSRPQNILVIMAGNIPLVGFFDLLCVIASGHQCIVKPSSKDRILTDFIIDQLQAIDPDVPITRYDQNQRIDAVIATGGENANRYFRNHYANLPTLLRGNRQSVAVLSGEETANQLIGLSDDIWAYSGLGCRNVSLLFIPKGYDLQLSMPQVNTKYRNNYRQTRAILEMTDAPFRDLGAAVLLEKREFPTALSSICFTRYQDLAEVETWLAEHDNELQCVVSECVQHTRRCGFGMAQAPKLTDWPDGQDTLRFLTDLTKTDK